MKEKIIKQKIVYSYDKDNGYYSGETIAYQNPLEKGKYLIPANSTDKKPIIKKGYLSKWDGKDWISEEKKELKPDIIEKTIDELILEKVQELEMYFNSDEARKFIFSFQKKDYEIINNSDIRNILTRMLIIFDKNQKIKEEDKQFTLNLDNQKTLILYSNDIKNLLLQLEDSRQQQFFNKEKHKTSIKSLKDKEAIKNYNFKS